MSDEGRHPHDLISTFSDHFATSEEAQRLHEHLQVCSECRSFLHDLRQIAAAVGEETAPPPPRDLAQRIRDRIEQPISSASSPRIVPFRRSPYPLAGAAALVLAAT